jgi:hypothetical protein
MKLAKNPKKGEENEKTMIKRIQTSMPSTLLQTRIQNAK